MNCFYALIFYLEAFTNTFILKFASRLAWDANTENHTACLEQSSFFLLVLPHVYLRLTTLPKLSLQFISMNGISQTKLAHSGKQLWECEGERACVPSGRGCGSPWTCRAVAGTGPHSFSTPLSIQLQGLASFTFSA